MIMRPQLPVCLGGPLGFPVGCPQELSRAAFSGMWDLPWGMGACSSPAGDPRMPLPQPVPAHRKAALLVPRQGRWEDGGWGGGEAAFDSRLHQSGPRNKPWTGAWRGCFEEQGPVTGPWGVRKDRRVSHGRQVRRETGRQ